VAGIVGIKLMLGLKKPDPQYCSLVVNSRLNSAVDCVLSFISIGFEFDCSEEVKKVKFCAAF
jgi:hypothetical protein